MLQGRALAPWRTSSALLSKWLPSHFADTPIRLPTSFAPAAPAPAVSAVLLARAALEQPAAQVNKVPATPSKVVLGFDAAPAAIAPGPAVPAPPEVAPAAAAAAAAEPAPKKPATEAEEEATLLQLSSGTASPAGSSPDSVLPNAATLLALNAANDAAETATAPLPPSKRSGATAPADAASSPAPTAGTAAKVVAASLASTPLLLRTSGPSSAATTLLSLGGRQLVATPQRLVLSGRALRRGGAVGAPGGVGKRVAVVVPPGGVCGGCGEGADAAGAGAAPPAQMVRRQALASALLGATAAACGGGPLELGAALLPLPKVHKVRPAGAAVELVAA